MPKIFAVSLLFLMPLAAWSKTPTVQETCKQVLAMTREIGMLQVVEHIKKCYADSNTAVSSNKQKTLVCVVKHITAIHFDNDVASLLGYPRHPFLMDEAGSIRIHQELLKSGLSRNENESIAIMKKLNGQIEPCVK